MFGQTKTKNFEWNNNNVPQLKELSINLDFRLDTKEKKETSYPSTNTLFNIVIKENLITDSDSKRKEILKEIETKFEEVYSKLETVLLNSDKLSDEFHKNSIQL